MCVTADSDTSTGPELLAGVQVTHTGYNASAVVCDIGTSRVQGSHRNAPNHYEGQIGDVDKTSGWGDGRGKANTSSETSDITEVVLIVNLHRV